MLFALLLPPPTIAQKRVREGSASPLTRSLSRRGGGALKKEPETRIEKEKERRVGGRCFLLLTRVCIAADFNCGYVCLSVWIIIIYDTYILT